MKSLNRFQLIRNQWFLETDRIHYLSFPFYILPYLIQMNLNSKLLFFQILVVLAVYLTSVRSEQCSTLPKLPLYLGKGYDILMGNPMTSRIDPGFKFQVIVLEYTLNKTTEDKKFLIPDNISSEKAKTCSLESTASSYSGTQSYQNQLKTIASVGGGYNGLALTASFSSSVQYKSMSNKTTSEDLVVTQVSALCQSYKLLLDTYQSYKISTNYFTAVDESIKTSNWDNFISQYGTHYITELMLGGRAVQQTTYSRTKVAELKYKGIDVNVAAKVSYAKYYGDTSFSSSYNSTQLSEVQSAKQSTRNFYIGGSPPLTGNMVEWQSKIDEDSMPITYKMLPLSNLFKYHPTSGFNYTNAETLFYAALDKYCSTNKCQAPTADKALPVRKATVSISVSTTYGGSGGSFFAYNKTEEGWQIRKIKMRSGSQVDNIQVSSTNGTITEISKGFGGTGGSEKTQWVVPNGQYINAIQLRAGERVDSLKFHTDKGSSSPNYGGTGGTSKMQTVPSGYRLAGIYGRAGSRLDQIGFVFTKTEYSYSHHNLEKA